MMFKAAKYSTSNYLNYCQKVISRKTLWYWKQNISLTKYASHSFFLGKSGQYNSMW